jgi:hypothetical protein
VQPWLGVDRYVYADLGDADATTPDLSRMD